VNPSKASAGKGAAEKSATGKGAAKSGKGASKPGPDAQVRRIIREHHLCDVCAKAKDLPHMPVVKNTMADIWKLLQYSAQQTRKRAAVRCPDCGMTLEEFRKKGRLGCPKDYEVFRPHIEELLERVHGATSHVGRIPGLSEKELLRIQRMTDLQQELEIAIREEAYENAARIRDELKELEVSGGSSPAGEHAE
jgi:protein arginine kinase activator